MDRELRGEAWKKRMGNLLSGKTVGIIGFGRIGRKVASLLGSFGCNIFFSDPFVKDISGYMQRSLEELLKVSDIVSLHVSSKSCILGEKEISIMKKGAWLVNVSRGAVVDEKSLYSHLKDKHLAGAALDVFSQEPYQGTLRELDNVVLTPHIGSYAVESRIQMEQESAENLVKGLVNA